MNRSEYRRYLLKMSDSELETERSKQYVSDDMDSFTKYNDCKDLIYSRATSQETRKLYSEAPKTNRVPVAQESTNETFNVFREALMENGYWNSIVSTLMHAEAKHPVWPTDNVYRAGILAEESGEVMRAAVQYEMEGGDIDAIRTELLQTAAMCVRFLKAIDGQKGTKQK